MNLLFKDVYTIGSINKKFRCLLSAEIDILALPQNH